MVLGRKDGCDSDKDQTDQGGTQPPLTTWQYRSTEPRTIYLDLKIRYAHDFFKILNITLNLRHNCRYERIHVNNIWFFFTKISYMIIDTSELQVKIHCN